MNKLLLLSCLAALLLSGCGEKKLPKLVDTTPIPIEELLEREDLSDEVKVVLVRAQESGLTSLTEQQLKSTIQQAEAKIKAETEEAKKAEAEGTAEESDKSENVADESNDE